MDGKVGAAHPQGGRTNGRAAVLQKTVANATMKLQKPVKEKAAARAAFQELILRVYLKTHDVTGSEGFLRCARHFFAGILTYFKEK